jgi:hypothetical protein
VVWEWDGIGVVDLLVAILTVRCRKHCISCSFELWRASGTGTGLVIGVRVTWDGSPGPK